MLKPRKPVCEMPEYHSPLCDPVLDLRLDMNESTVGCSPRVLEKLRTLDAKTLALYPSREQGESIVANFLGLNPSEVLLTNGADEAIDLLCRAYLDPEDEIILVTPAFTMYEVFASATGARIVPVAAEEDLAFPTARVVQAVTPRTRIIVITNPNNPTGLAAERTDILKVIESAPNTAVLLDEAYFDFCGKTLLDKLGKLPNLFIVRTFSKAYGLAGLRVGVLAGPEGQLSILRRLCPPFNLNVFALECLREALDDRQFIQDYVKQTIASREWLRSQLESLGLKCWPSETNFLLVQFGPLKKIVLQGMNKHGIALRDRPDCEGCIRISIGTKAEMERLVSTLQGILYQPQVSSAQGRGK